MKAIKIRTELLLLAGAIIIGAFLRFYNLNWDAGQLFHPDERNIANAVTKIHFFDQLNPEFFAYGGFSIYLYRAAGEVLEAVTNDNSWISDWGKINIIGRHFSAFFSTLTILIVYLLARKLFDKQVGLLSAVLFAFAVSSIQTAHYAVTESLLTFLAPLIAFVSITLLEKPSFFQYIKLGLLLGLAIAAKTSALSFAVLPAIATLSHMGFSVKKVAIPATRFIIMALIALLIFTVFSPYTFIAWDKFKESMDYEGGVVRGTLQVPYTLQFSHTTPYLFQIKNLFWQMGPIFFFSLLGVFWTLYSAIKHKDMKILIFLSFPLAYFSYVGIWYAKFIRYMMPIVPFLAIVAAYTLIQFKQRFKIVGLIWIVLFTTLTTLYAFAFFSIYTKAQTRIEASEWIYQNIPFGSKILTEHWDDGLPIPLSSIQHPGVYKTEALEIYNQDNEQKLNYYATKLSDADYIVISSRRLYGTLMNLPEKYPLTSSYYRMLFDGKLGYEKVAEFTSYPTLFGIEINDDASEETFQVYDHPKVIVLKNNLRYSQETYLRLLRPYLR